MKQGGGGYIGRGAGLACRDWPWLAWLYLANLALGLVATADVGAQVGRVLNTSLESQRLVHGLDLAALAELLLRSDVTPRALLPVSFLSVALFAVVTLFFTPGIVEGFLSDEHPPAGRFFQACGAWFWRFTRLTLLSWLILGPVLGVLNAVRGALLDAAGKSPNPRLYFYVGLGALLVMWLVAVVLRLWFDLAQFHLVHTQERKVRRAIPAGLRLLRQGFFRLFWIYFSITLVGWLGLAAGLWVWVKLPPQRVGLAFLVGQAILILWLATRFWQRAAEALWFRAHAPAPAAPPAPAEALPLSAPEVPLPAPPASA